MELLYTQLSVTMKKSPLQLQHNGVKVSLYTTCESLPSPIKLHKYCTKYYIFMIFHSLTAEKQRCVALSPLNKDAPAVDDRCARANPRL